MKKSTIVILLAVLLVLLWATAAFLAVKKASPAKATIISAGSAAESFVVGMRDSAGVRLKEFFGKYTIVLTFLGEDNQSLKFDAKMKQTLKEKLNARENLLWFTVKKTGFFCVIEEQTGKFGLKYRTIWSDLPKAYNFSDLPSVIIIDKFGIIKFVYMGYSPTMVDDLNIGLKEKK